MMIWGSNKIIFFVYENMTGAREYTLPCSLSTSGIITNFFRPAILIYQGCTCQIGQIGLGCNLWPKVIKKVYCATKFVSPRALGVGFVRAGLKLVLL